MGGGYLYNEGYISPQHPDGYQVEPVRIVGRKKRCRSSWCPLCGIKAIYRALQRVRQMRWDRVRRVDLTLDPSLFKSPAEANKACERKISDTVQALERQTGRVVLDYRWFKEWHEDGFPHWHVLIEFDGPPGMLGGDLLRSVWGFGRVFEGYFKSRAHWDAFVGYMGKTGYMGEGKEHQTTLPEWAMETHKRVRRYGGALEDRDEKIKELQASEGDWDAEWPWIEDHEKKSEDDFSPHRTNREIIASCGSSVELLMLEGAGELTSFGYSRETYKEWKQRGGEYVEKIGWVVVMTPREWHEHFMKHIRVDWDPMPRPNLTSARRMKPKSLGPGRKPNK